MTSITKEFQLEHRINELRWEKLKNEAYGPFNDDAAHIRYLKASITKLRSENTDLRFAVMNLEERLKKLEK